MTTRHFRRFTLTLLSAGVVLAATPLAARPPHHDGVAHHRPPVATAPADPVQPDLSAAPALKHGLVAAANPQIADAGMRMLAAGGNAVDAAMAMMLAGTVVEPQSSGIGGGGFLVTFDPASGAIDTIDGRETTPAAAKPTRFLDANGQPLSYGQAEPGGRSVGVPGNVALMALAHKKWGKLPWAKLFEPAIQYADGGFEVSKPLADTLARLAPAWADFPATRAIYWVDGAPARAGMTLKNPALAHALERIAAGGADAFYAGQTAQDMVSAVQQSRVAPGDLTMLDLTAYAAKERPAVCGAYRGYKICGMGPPSAGATTVIELLGMLQRFDLAKLGPDSPVAWHLIDEAMRLTYADRDKWMGDSDFLSVPVAGLIDPAYIAARSKLIRADGPADSYAPGTPPMAAPRTDAPPSEVPGTTHFVAVDPAGRIASMTSTVEGFFGSQLVADGFVLNNELTDFSFVPVDVSGAPVANAVQAGKRPLSSMAPTIVFDRTGRAVLTVGSAGGRRIPMHVVKVLIGVIDFGLPLRDAMALPNIFASGDTTLVEAGTPLATMADALQKLGHPVQVVALPSKLDGAQLTPAGWIAANDPRVPGAAIAQ